MNLLCVDGDKVRVAQVRKDGHATAAPSGDKGAIFELALEFLICIGVFLSKNLAQQHVPKAFNVALDVFCSKKVVDELATGVAKEFRRVAKN